MKKIVRLLLSVITFSRLLNGVVCQPSTVFDGTFLQVPSNWETDIDYGGSIIRTPTIDFINDTATTLVWILDTSNNLLNIPTHFLVERSLDPVSDDFSSFQKLQVIIPLGYRNSTFTTTHTIGGLQPEYSYRFRVCPFFLSGRRHCSRSVVVTTLAPSVNYWEPILTRRLSLGTTNRGFNYPVVQRPHLDTGVEVFDQSVSENPIRHADSPTDQTPVLPSGRRGHSLSLVDGSVYMFGGRTNGYTCSNVYKDTLNLGNVESGREVYPCTSKQSEVNEVWSFDTSTYQWVFLNTTKWMLNPSNDAGGQPVVPPPREQHAAVVIDKDIYIYGGKSRSFETTEDGEILFTHHSDMIFGDLWKLSVEREEQYILRHTNYSLWTGCENGSYCNNGSSSMDVTSNETALSAISGDPNTNNFNGSVAIPQGSAKLLSIIDGNLNLSIAAQSDGVTPREGLCIDKMIVRVTIEHPCIKQLRASLLGPGPLTGSPNYFPHSDAHEVLLFNNLATTNGSTDCGGGVHRFEFDDSAVRKPETCCQNTYNGTYRPQGRLAEFIGASMSAQWTLQVQDLQNDEIAGSLVNWEIEFTASPCFRSFTWTNLTSVYADGYSATTAAADGNNSTGSSTPPPNRYAALSIAYKNSFFIYGGRDVNDFPLHDLYRFDLDTLLWTELRPLTFDDVVLSPSSSVGSSLALAAWGLIRYGGYYRQPYMAQAAGHYDSSVGVQDPITLRWRAVEVQPSPFRAGSVNRRVPSGRYLAAAVFIPADSLRWKTRYTHRNLYDQPLPSTRTNFQGGISDSLLVFGGFDGATGSVYDGSSGGYFSDAWMLRLSSWSTPGSRYSQTEYIGRNCRWRTGETALRGGRVGEERGRGGTEACMGPSGSYCELRDLLLLSWCDSTNQTVS